MGSALTSGTKLGRYEIRGLLGAGGMGEVYRARDTELGRDVAVKVLPSSFSADRDRLSRFKQEACDASGDGQRFLVSTLAGESNPTPLTVVLNWTAGIKR